jgi:hypothetical protein
MGGHNAKWVGRSTNLDVYFVNPWVAGNHVSFEARYLHRDRPNELDRFQEVANELEGRFGSFIRGSGRIGLLAAFSTVRSDRAGVTISPDNEDAIARLGVYVGYDTRDIWSRPGTGWNNELDFSRNQALDTEAGFWTIDIDIRRYDTWRQRHTLMLTSLTTLQSGAVGKDVEGIRFHFGLYPKVLMQRQRVR